MASTANSTNTPGRRGFLRGLLSLPLIGGGVTLIGQPSAVAELVTRELMLRYSEWLRVERNALHEEIWPHEEPRLRQYSAFPQTLGEDNVFYVPPGPASLRQTHASTRAALIMSTAGADWR